MNQTLNDNNLEMKKEQRKVLDELEKQLSSLINEKEKLEERQVVLLVKPNSRGQDKPRNIKTETLACNLSRFFSFSFFGKYFLGYICVEF